MLKNERVKIFIIAALFILAITLFYFYISSDDATDKLKEPKKLNESAAPYSRDKMLFDIDSILYSFGIKKEWMKDISAQEKDSKSNKEQLLISKEVRIPPDLQTIDLNFEVTEYLRINNLENKVMEDPKSKNIAMTILSFTDSPGKTVGNLKFIYSDTLKRNVADVCLVLDSLDEYSLSDVEKILNSTQEYSMFLPLRNDKADYQSRIIELGKDFLLKFSVGNFDDLEADFKEDMKESLWKSKVRSASLNFPQASGIILINNGSNPEFYQTIKDEFIKNSIIVYSDSIFSNFGKGVDKINSLFEHISSEAKNGKKFLFYDINLNPDEFDSYDKKVYMMKRLGYKFLNFKELIKSINNNNENRNSL